MQYVRSISGSVSKTWNSINPATLSGAIDVIVVENEDGTLACSPFHVRFGKFSLLRPFEKKVEFKVNNERQDYAMKLGEGGEAFFVFETSSPVPEGLQTSPVVSPVASPSALPAEGSPLPELEPLDLAGDIQRPGTARSATATGTVTKTLLEALDRPGSGSASLSSSPTNTDGGASWTKRPERPVNRNKAMTADTLIPRLSSVQSFPGTITESPTPSDRSVAPSRSASPPTVGKQEAYTRAITLSKKLWSSNIPSQVNDAGDLMLDMTGYKSSEEDSLRAELVARKILTEELEGDYDIGSLIGADEKGNLWIYSSEEARDEAARRAAYPVILPSGMLSTDALSDPGYGSDDNQSPASLDLRNSLERRESDSAVGMVSPPDSPPPMSRLQSESTKNFAKTLRLTSDQLKSLKLKPGPNSMSFTVNRATCQAYMYLWKHDVPIVISDIDGTITKSDALGHVLNMIGRDWTHLGVAKLYTDISNNGYNIFYLTSRSVGQADTTRAYLAGIVQDGHKLPRGPVIMSPDRTIAALRREIYLRKPEVFKMACLRDIKNLFGRNSPFYAGFGNRLTDALSYRSVNIPSMRIFTINANAEVSLDLLSLSKYKTGYVSMRETVDHFFPPVGTLVHEGGEDFTDFNYWRDAPLDLADISPSDSGDEAPQRRLKGRSRESRRGSDDDGSDAEGDQDADDDILSEDQNDMEASYMSRDSIDESLMARLSIEQQIADDADAEEEEEAEAVRTVTTTTTTTTTINSRERDDEADATQGRRDVESAVNQKQSQKQLEERPSSRASSGMLRTSLQNLAVKLNVVSDPLELDATAAEGRRRTGSEDE